MWLLVIYANDNKDEVIKVHRFNSIRQIAYVLDESPRDVSNYYHGLILARGNIKYIDMFKR